MTPLRKNQVVADIQECERLSTMYAKLYDILSCEGFEMKDFAADDRKQLDKELAGGEITSLADLGRRFDDFSDREYRKANLLLKKDFKKAI